MLGFLAVLGMMWMAPPCATGACSCATPRDVPSALRTADAVFTGEVVSVRTISVGRGDMRRQVKRVRLWVNLSWKGVDNGSISVITGMGDADCGFDFRRGESYLVFASRADGGLNTGICGRTAELARAAADVRALGPPAYRWRR